MPKEETKKLKDINQKRQLKDQKIHTQKDYQKTKRYKPEKVTKK